VNAQAQPYVSIVTPVRNGAGFIERSLREMLASLDQLEAPCEVIVVCDGGTDGTLERATAVADPRVRVLHYDRHQGKGVAITAGLAQARGRLVGWLDSDLDIHPDVIVQAVRCFERSPGIDAVIGSKRHPDSQVRYPFIRRVYSWGFQMLVRALFRINVRDTQVGAKLFRREMLDTVVPLLLIKRFAFDLELLAVGAEFGFDRVQEMPVDLSYRFTGTGVNWKAARYMFVDSLAIAYRIHLRHWYVRRYASLQRQRGDAMMGLDARPDEDRISVDVGVVERQAETEVYG
jgi:dolichol-phosphate mannosyltransferase